MTTKASTADNKNTRIYWYPVGVDIVLEGLPVRSTKQVKEQIEK